MRRVLLGIIFYLLAIMIVSALVTPPAFWLQEHVFSSPYPVRRVFNRVVMLSALVLLWPLVKFLGVGGWRQCGVMWDRSIPQCWLRWFGVGILTIVVLYLGQWLAGMVVWAPHSSWDRPFGYLLAGVLVGFLEELMFRGVLFRAWISENKWRTLWVALLGSVFFATAHFIKARDPVGAVTWLSGWQIWGEMGGHLLIWQEVVMRWLTLFWTGMMLCAVTWRYGHIWAAVGLHAGWVFALKTMGGLVSSKAAAGSIWFARDALEGLWPGLLLMAMCLTTVLLIQPRQRRL